MSTRRDEDMQCVHDRIGWQEARTDAQQEFNRHQMDFNRWVADRIGGEPPVPLPPPRGSR